MHVKCFILASVRNEWNSHRFTLGELFRLLFQLIVSSCKISQFLPINLYQCITRDVFNYLILYCCRCTLKGMTSDVKFLSGIFLTTIIKGFIFLKEALFSNVILIIESSTSPMDKTQYRISTYPSAI